MTNSVSDNMHVPDYIFNLGDNMFILCNPNCDCSFCNEFSKYCVNNPTTPFKYWLLHPMAGDDIIYEYDNPIHGFHRKQDFKLSNKIHSDDIIKQCIPGRFFIRYNADCDCSFCDNYNKDPIGFDKYWISLLNHNIKNR